MEQFMELDPDAVALRPVRIIRTKGRDAVIRHYTATTFPENPWGGCNLYLRRCRLFGGLSDADTDLLLDVLNEAEDIIQDYNLTRKGFEYLRKKLGFVVDPDPV